MKTQGKRSMGPKLAMIRIKSRGKTYLLYWILRPSVYKYTRCDKKIQGAGPAEWLVC